MIAAGEVSRGSCSSARVFHWSSSSAVWRSRPAEFRDPRDHAGVDAEYQSIGFLAFIVATQQPAGAAGDIGHVHAPLIQDQVKAGTEAIPAFGAPRRGNCGC